MPVPFFKPSITEREISEVVDALRSGWLTTGPRTAKFEAEFARAVQADHAVAVNSCTAALHLAVAALGLGPGQAVLVPTMTFAATAEVVRYLGGLPILVDCEAGTLNLDFADAERKIAACEAGSLPSIPQGTRVVGIMPVHVGGLMVDIDRAAPVCEASRLVDSRGCRARVSRGVAPDRQRRMAPMWFRYV